MKKWIRTFRAEVKPGEKFRDSCGRAHRAISDPFGFYSIEGSLPSVCLEDYANTWFLTGYSPKAPVEVYREARLTFLDLAVGDKFVWVSDDARTLRCTKVSETSYVDSVGALWHDGLNDPPTTVERCS